MSEFEFFLNLIRMLSENVKKERVVEYSQDSENEEVIGITSLLACPLKTYYRKLYPQIQYTNLEIDEGYLFEQQVKSALKELYKDKFHDEYVVEYTHDGIKIEGHIDCLIEFDNEIISLELKVPRSVYLAKPIKNLRDVDVIFDEDNDTVIINEKYILQAQIQKFLLMKKHPDKTIHHYLFLKTLVVSASKQKKAYIVYPIKQHIDEETLKRLISAYKSDKRPRIDNECIYCPYFNTVCDGSNETSDILKKILSSLNSDDKSLMNMIKRYYDIKDELKKLEWLIKSKLKDRTIRYGNKTIGNVEYEMIEIDTKKLIQKAIDDGCLDKLCDEKCLTVNWRHKQNLIKRFGEEIIKEKRKEKRFKL